MTNVETDIMRHFRQYHVGINDMLFFNTSLANSDSPKFYLAMASLIRSGLVIKERRRHAYSLTFAGYMASRSA